MSHLVNFKTKKKKTVVLAVTNDLETDNRVHKVASSLLRMGFEVTVVGRLLPKSNHLERNYSTRRFSLLFNNGLLFYANYNIRLFFFLLFKQFDLVVSNDLDTLLASFVASKTNSKPIVYDSHEYFTEVPELVDRPFIKNTWETIERLILPHIKHCYTVCDSIAEIYNSKYKTNFKVVRNVPFKKDNKNVETNPPFPTDLPIILYQGAVNIGRGIEEAILAMQSISDTRLVIIGDGDLLYNCKKLVQDHKLADKVYFTGRINIETLSKLTTYATLGLSVEKDIGLNYRYALPNKLFDYIQSEVPIIASSLPEIKRIVTSFKIGICIEETTPNKIATAIKESLSSPKTMQTWKANCKEAKNVLCWENEEVVLNSIYTQFL